MHIGCMEYFDSSIKHGNTQATCAHCNRPVLSDNRLPARKSELITESSHCWKSFHNISAAVKTHVNTQSGRMTASAPLDSLMVLLMSTFKRLTEADTLHVWRSLPWTKMKWQQVMESHLIETGLLTHPHHLLYLNTQIPFTHIIHSFPCLGGQVLI